MAFFKLLPADRRREIEGQPLFDPFDGRVRENSHHHALGAARTRYPEIEWQPDDIATIEMVIQAGQSQRMFARERRQPRIGELHRLTWANTTVYVVYNNLQGLVKTFLTEEMIARDWG